MAEVGINSKMASNSTQHVCPCCLHFRSNLIFLFLPPSFIQFPRPPEKARSTTDKQKLTRWRKGWNSEGREESCLSVCRSAISHGQLEIRALQWKIMASCAQCVCLLLSLSPLSDPQSRSNCLCCLFSSTDSVYPCVDH